MNNPNNASFNRWVKASLADHFSSLSRHLHVDGSHRQTQQKETWFELRLPTVAVEQRTKNNWTVMINVDMACCAIHEFNAYLLEDLSGEVQSKMTRCIPFFKYDETLTDPVVALPNMNRENDPAAISLGEVKPDLKLFQTNVTCTYKVLI